MGDEDRWEALRGVLAGGVAAELADPLARIQAALAAAVDTMDRHVAHAKGPEPLPSHLMAMVREHLAEAYLELGRAVRLAGDLAAVTSGDGYAEDTVDPNDLVERAVALARHRTGAVRVDLGTVPTVRCAPARFTQAIAGLLVEVAAATRTPVEVQTRRAPDGVRIVLHGGAGELTIPPLVAAVLAEIGASVAAVGDGGRLRVTVSVPVVP